MNKDNKLEGSRMSSMIFRQKNQVTQKEEHEKLVSLSSANLCHPTVEQYIEFQEEIKENMQLPKNFTKTLS